VKIKLLLTALTIVLTTGATAQPNPYAACIAEAAPIYGSVLTIEQLRQYMAEHPSCADGTTPATALPYAPRPAGTNSFTTTDLADIATTYQQNEPRFKREYVGRQFQGKMLLRNIKDDLLELSGVPKKTRVEFGSAFCVVPRGSINGIDRWKPSDKFEVTGIIKDVWFGNVELGHCSFRLSLS
jgi:hypothetical protein